MTQYLSWPLYNKLLVVSTCDGRTVYGYIRTLDIGGVVFDISPSISLRLRSVEAWAACPGGFHSSIESCGYGGRISSFRPNSGLHVPQYPPHFPVTFRLSCNKIKVYMNLYVVCYECLCYRYVYVQISWKSFNVLPLKGFGKRANTPVINIRKDQWWAKELMIKTNGMSIGYR